MTTFTDGYGGDVNTEIDMYAAISTPDTNQSTYNKLYFFYSAGNSAVEATTFLKFTLTSIPDGSVIDSANLHLFQETAGTTLPYTATIHRIKSANSAWFADITKPTWNHKVASTDRWAGDAASNGGADAGCTISETDYEATAIGTLNGDRVNGSGYEYTISLATAQIKSMLTADYGLVIIMNSGGAAYTELCGCRYTTTGYRPKLVITYHAAALRAKTLLGVGV